MGGGPSHIDLYDLKPQAPAEIRGEFLPIATSVPGIQISEHLPHLARVMHRVAIVRSVTHGTASHLPASHWMMTGYQPSPSTTTNVNPYAGAVVSRTRGPNVVGMPAYVSIPRRQLLGGPAYLGPAYNPFTTESDPNAANFAVLNLRSPAGIDGARMHDRQALLSQLDRLRADADRRGEFAGIDKFSRQALEIVTGTRRRKHLTSAAKRQPLASDTVAPSAGKVACWRGGWSKRASRSSRFFPVESGTRIATILPRSKTARCRRSIGRWRPWSMICTSARTRSPRARARVG